MVQFLLTFVVILGVGLLTLMGCRSYRVTKAARITRDVGLFGAAASIIALIWGIQ